jgi:hypothetical protein
VAGRPVEATIERCGVPTTEEIKEEDRRIRRLRIMAELTMSLILQTDMTHEEASEHAASVRELAIRLFPGKGEVYDLLYGPRFRRLIAERYRLN